VLGTGATVAEVKLMGPSAFHLTDLALVCDIPGPQARTVPVRHECEEPLLAMLAHLRESDPAGSLLTGLEIGSTRIGRLFDHHALEVDGVTLRPSRLRTTWVALVTASGVPLPALLRAAGIRGDKTFTHVASAIDPDHDPALAITALRGSTGPLPMPGQLLLPGRHYPAPRVPLREQDGDR
jgi:hypothetical protein